MLAQTFWKTVTADRTDFLTRLLTLLKEHRIRYCVIGGQGVNAYVEPVVSLGLDLVIATGQIKDAERLLGEEFTIEPFPHSLNVSAPGSDLQAQIQTDPRYFPFVERASTHDVLGLSMPVARVEDVLQGKLWAVQDAERRSSKRQKDLADIARLLEAYPALRQQVPADVLKRLL
jgi:hypothetical protein